MLEQKDAKLASQIFKRDKSSVLPHRRDRHDIIAEILRTASEGQKKTNIMYKARLSHSQLKLYLEFLKQNGMIASDDGYYKTTSKGMAFVKEFEAMSFLFGQ